MKKLILVLILLLIPGLSFAGSQQIMSVIGMAKGQGGGGASCMSGTYLFAWDGSHTSGTDYGCNGSGTEVDGTVVGALDIGTDYGEGSPDIGIKGDAVNEYITWPNSGGVPLDINGVQTVWVRVYVNATPLGNTILFAANYDATNYLKIAVNSTRNIVGYHRIGAASMSAYGDVAITAGTWIDIAYTWDRPNRDHSVNSDGTWDDDYDELSATDGPSLTSVSVGPRGEFSMTAGDYVQVTKFAILNGWQAAKPW